MKVKVFFHMFEVVVFKIISVAFHSLLFDNVDVETKTGYYIYTAKPA